MWVNVEREQGLSTGSKVAAHVRNDRGEGVAMIEDIDGDEQIDLALPLGKELLCWRSMNFVGRVEVRKVEDTELLS